MTINDPPEYPGQYFNPGPGTPPPDPQYVTTPPPAPKKKKTPWIIGGVVAAVALCGGCIGVVANSDSGKKGSDAGKPVTSVSSAAPKASSKKPEPLPTKGAHVPTPKEIKLTIKITKKQCFGSAGCLVDFRIGDLTYSGDNMDPDKDYEVVYEVKGLKDPYTNTLTLHGNGRFEYQEEENGQTSTTKVSLKAVVTSVEEL